MNTKGYVGGYRNPIIDIFTDYTCTEHIERLVFDFCDKDGLFIDYGITGSMDITYKGKIFTQWDGERRTYRLSYKKYSNFANSIAVGKLKRRIVENRGLKIIPRSEWEWNYDYVIFNGDPISIGIGPGRDNAKHMIGIQLAFMTSDLIAASEFIDPNDVRYYFEHDCGERISA